ncbi:MAG: cytochrome c biogenesis protein ResB, partial [Bacteroidales bacterium]|nr:cytochrome c biogenesis protein ResB [Bacteroidales bacterium]
MKKARVILMVLVVVVLAAGTIFEKYRGAEWVGDHFYGSWWFAVLLGLVAVGVIVAIWFRVKSEKRKAKLQKTKFSIFNSQFSIYLIHAAVPIILLGGALTTWTGEHYSITLAPGETKEGITLESFEVLYYPGTHTPMDFVSHVTTDGEPFDISMNHILRHDGRRYYQEDYDEEGRTTLSVSHDTWGIPVTYTGYALLLIGLGWLMIKRSERDVIYRSEWGVNKGSERGVKGTIVKSFLILLIFNFQFSIVNSAQAAPRTLPRETASKMGEMYVLYKGRICPVQTFAKDFTTKLTGKATYEGLSSEQVLSGFLFYYEDWASVLNDVKPKRQKESKALVEMLLSGHGLKLFPVADSTDTLFNAHGDVGAPIGWYAQNDELPMTVSDEEYIFIRKHLSYCQELVVKGDYEALNQVFEKIRLFQEKRAAGLLPSPSKVKAERLYNALTTGRWLAMLTLTLGLILFAYSLYTTTQKRTRKFSIFIFQLSIFYLFLLTFFLLLIFVLRWIVGGHIPMAGGFDSMNLMAMAIGILGLVLSFRSKRFSILNSQFSISIALLSMGFCLLVAMMSGSNPPVTNLMPVLSSPLL